MLTGTGPKQLNPFTGQQQTSAVGRVDTHEGPFHLMLIALTLIPVSCHTCIKAIHITTILV